MFARHRPIPWLVRLIAPLALLLLLTPWAAAQGAPRQAPLPPPPGTAPPFALYLASGFPPTHGYAPINPRTLADLPGGALLRVGSGASLVLVSGNGATAATETANGSEIVELATWDLRTGRERAHVSLVGSLFALSQDGTRFVASVNGATPPSHDWEVFDAATGRIVRTIPEEATGPQGFLFDDVAWRMYRFYAPGAPSTTVRVVATDLTTGKDLGQVTVPNLQAGAWPTSQPGRGQPVLQEYAPAFALSPDGRQIAVVHPARDAVTLVETQPLRVERTVAFGPRASLGSRLASLLPLWPNASEAKGSGGVYRSAIFAPDGRHLYVYGARYTLDGMQVVPHYMGLEVVNLANDTATRPMLTNEDIVRVLPGPDEQSVYVASFTRSGYETTGYHVRRLDAMTLRPLAERSFDRYRPLLLLPKAPNAH